MRPSKRAKGHQAADNSNKEITIEVNKALVAQPPKSQQEKRKVNFIQRNIQKLRAMTKVAGKQNENVSAEMSLKLKDNSSSNNNKTKEINNKKPAAAAILKSKDNN